MTELSKIPVPKDKDAASKDEKQGSLIERAVGRFDLGGFNPPPVPTLSTLGVLNFEPRPNCSATAEEKGNTVDEPAMLM